MSSKRDSAHRTEASEAAVQTKQRTELNIPCLIIICCSQNGAYILLCRIIRLHTCALHSNYDARALAHLCNAYTVPRLHIRMPGQGRHKSLYRHIVYVCVRFFFRFKWSASHTHTAGIRPFQVFIFYAWIAVWWPRHSVAIALGSRTESHRWLCAYAQRNRNVIPFFFLYLRILSIALAMNERCMCA